MSGQSDKPHVVIVGGYLTEPLFYWRLRDRLLRRGAASVSITRLHWPDWLAVSFVGFGPAMLRAARSIREARRHADAPLLVVGHSAGGFLSRLAMSEVAFEGRRAGVAADVGCLVTLGTPHRIYPTIPFWPEHPGVRATRFLDRVSPGAAFAPTTGYLTVGSTLVPTAQKASTVTLTNALHGAMRKAVGHDECVGSDGIVGNDLAQLRGVRHIELPDVLHGTLGGPWYGDGHAVDRWWPVALETWRRALDARHTDAI